MLTKCQSLAQGNLHVAIFLGHGRDVTGSNAPRKNHFAQRFMFPVSAN